MQKYTFKIYGQKEMKQYLIISIMLISLFTISCQSKENIGSNKNYEKVNYENIKDTIK